MPFFLIRGTFHIQGYSPDGDSIRFQAENRENWAKLSGPAVGVNARGHAQLRLEAIDTLETHFMNQHQPQELALKALNFLLESLGITGLQTDPQLTLVTAAQDATPGYILSRAADGNHRPIAFVFRGVPPEEDGAKVILRADRLRQSVNFGSLTAGLAYPTYYKGLFPDLRQACNDAVGQARDARLEIWAQDVTNSGFVCDGLPSITERNVILPKLFRRLVEFLAGGGTSVAGFKAWLEARPDDVLVISDGHFTHLDTLVEVTGNNVRLTEPPENLVFLK